jgi:hypothetical protein
MRIAKVAKEATAVLKTGKQKARAETGAAKWTIQIEVAATVQQYKKTRQNR